METKLESLSIIIPFYNEEENIPTLYSAVKEVVSSIQREQRECEVIFIDDGSTDNGYKIINDLSAKDPVVKLIKFQFNCGQTAAMQAGFDYSKNDIIIPMDADMQNDPSDIPHLISKLSEGYDVVSGWRKNRKDNTINRKIPSFLANKLISIIGKVKLHDYGCSLKAYRRTILKNIKLYGEMHRFIPIYASWYGARVTELPVKHHSRTKGKSKYGISRTFKVILDLITIKFLGNYMTKPLYFFGSIGLLSIFLAFLSSLYLVYKHLMGMAIFDSPFLPFSIMCILLGVQFILMGLIAELIIRTYHETQNKRSYTIETTHNIEK